MKTFKHLAGFLLLVVFCACGESSSTKKLSKEELISEIKLLEKKILSNGNLEIDKVEAEKLVDYYLEFAANYSKEPSVDDYLFKAADIAKNLGRPLQAVDIYVQIINDYPASEKASLSLFLQAFLFDNDLNDDKKAGELYKEFLEKYPTHELVESAKFSIDNLGKSDEELIREFEKKNATLNS